MAVNKTEIVLIVDRSGSMHSMRDDAEGGLKAFLEDQRDAPGEARLTLVLFDDRYEVVHDGADLAGLPTDVRLEPRGATALFDAVGRTIDRVGEQLAATPEPERPGAVLVCVVTDGQENASSDYTAGRVREMVTHQERKYGWQFTFLGAGPEVFAQGAGMGFDPSAGAAFEDAGAALRAASGKAKRVRAAFAAGAAPAAAAAANRFTDAERRAMARK